MIFRALGIDPGKTTGYSLVVGDPATKKISATTEFGWMKDESIEEVRRIIEGGLDVVVCESFLVRPVKARAGHFDNSDMVAPRMIGKIELLCEMHGVDLHMQPAAVKPAAYGFANLQYKKGAKNKHWQDAHAHVVYYLVKRLFYQPIAA